MAIKQILAVEAMEKVCAGKVIMPSLTEVPNGWLALLINAQGKKLVCVSSGECPLAKMLVIESSDNYGDLKIEIMDLNSNNAAVVRHFIKWVTPSACGTKGTSIGFSDWLGLSSAAITKIFEQKQLKPVLVECSSSDTELLQINFLEAVDAATWGVLEQGYKKGYGANAEGLKTEEDIVKALLYGYSMIGLDCSEKINLQIEKMDAADIEARYNDFPQEFRDAMKDSYLEADFKLGEEVIHFEPIDLYRIVLEYGEAIMHAQFIYNSYLKNTPWDIDFEILVSKKGKILSPQEHYLIANELSRNNIKFETLGLDAVEEGEKLKKDLKVHAAISETFGYRLSFLNADLGIADLGAVAKILKGKVHFKLSNILWMAALKLLEIKAPELLKEMLTYAKLQPSDLSAIELQSSIGKSYAESYLTLLAPTEGNFVERIKNVLIDNITEYEEQVSFTTRAILKTL